MAVDGWPLHVGGGLALPHLGSVQGVGGPPTPPHPHTHMALWRRQFPKQEHPPKVTVLWLRTNLASGRLE